MTSKDDKELNGKFLPKEKWPHTIGEAVDHLLANLSDSDKETIKNSSESELFRYHHGLGTYIRNQFGLWKRNLLKEPFHPDDVSMFIIIALWKRLNSINRKWNISTDESSKMFKGVYQSWPHCD
jgi:hypothetical protein